MSRYASIAGMISILVFFVSSNSSLRGQTLLVANQNANHIERFGGLPGPISGGNLEFPRGMTFGPDGNLYVSSTDLGTPTGSILRFEWPSGAFVDEFVTAGSGGLTFPGGVVFGPDGNLYVANRDTSLLTNNVLRFDGETGAFIDVPGPLRG